MRYLVVAFVMLLCAISVRAQTWRRIDNGIPPNSSINDVKFISEQRGFVILNDGNAYSTSNGGSLWTLLDPVDCSKCIVYYSGILFFSKNEGYLWATKQTKGQDSELMFKSTDMGLTWFGVPLVSRYGNYLKSFRLELDAGVMMVQGSGDPVEYTVGVFRSIDSGRTVDTLYFSMMGSTNGVSGYGYVADSSNILISYNYGSPITMVSENGGHSWGTQPIFFSESAYLGDSQWIGLKDAVHLYKGNGFGTWIEFSRTPTNISSLVSLKDGLNLYATTYDSLHRNELLRSNDGGLHWKFERVDIDSVIYPYLRWYSANFAYLFTWSGRIYRNDAPAAVASPPIASSPLPYPNPASDFVNIPGCTDPLVTVVDDLGRRFELQNSGERLDCSQLRDGAYTINGASRIRFVVDRTR